MARPDYSNFYICGLLLLLFGCKHPLIIVGEGDIVDLNNSGFGCTLEQFQAEDEACASNEVSGDYHVKYEAVARPGWRFVEWQGLACTWFSEEPYCEYVVDEVHVSNWDANYPGVEMPATIAVFEPIPAEDPLNYFTENVSDSVVQAQCIACHTIGGLSEHTRLVFVPDSDPNYHTLNYQKFADLAAEQENASDYILTKVQGVDHGGGVQLSSGSDGFETMSEFLFLLTGDAWNPGISGGLFDGYTLAAPEETLRRASVIVGGSLPSSLDDAAVAEGDDAVLRQILRDLMTGEGFHKFLIEGANDRLLTEKWLENRLVNVFFPYYPDLANYFYDNYESGDLAAFAGLVNGIDFGYARSPLELIAYVVEQEKPYTEILTADYTMVNPPLVLPYRADVEFADETNIDQWLPATVDGYERIGRNTVIETGERGSQVTGGLATDYPHAGILNTPGWLARYPSTATNRNRARARWTWYHFLGVDIERLAARTTDPVALADTDNPTMKNPNCTVCHEVLDPVAGVYQNYGDTGFYKNKPPGNDSLPRLYKQDDSLEDPYQNGDVWYRDMREPGFEQMPFTNTDSTLQDFAAHIVGDHRFAIATVKFWWPALMGEEAATLPEDAADVDYLQRLQLYETQAEDIEGLASGFEAGFNGGLTFNLKDLLVEMMMTNWFRADSRIVETGADDETHHLGIGSGKLLTPEQLDRKTESVTGFRWYETERRGIEVSQLDGAYKLFYGGIDSDGVTKRATAMTALMSTVVEAQPLQMACVLVAAEFNTPREARRIFTEVDKSDTEITNETAIRDQLLRMHELMLGETLSESDPELNRSFDLFKEVRQDRLAKNYATRLDTDDEACPFQLIPAAGSLDLSDPSHSLNTWVSMMIYFMTDYGYVYE